VRDLVQHLPAPTTTMARSIAMRVLWERLLTVDLGARLTEDSPARVPVPSGLGALDGIL
jgi:hypothetical protein